MCGQKYQGDQLVNGGENKVDLYYAIGASYDYGPQSRVQKGNSAPGLPNNYLFFFD